MNNIGEICRITDHFKRGGRVQSKQKSVIDDPKIAWFTHNENNITWNFQHIVYRIHPEEKAIIDHYTVGGGVEYFSGTLEKWETLPIFEKFIWHSIKYRKKTTAEKKEEPTEGHDVPHAKEKDHHKRGGRIQIYGLSTSEWEDCSTPVWFPHRQYRIHPEEQKIIDHFNAGGEVLWETEATLEEDWTLPKPELWDWKTFKFWIEEEPKEIKPDESWIKHDGSGECPLEEDNVFGEAKFGVGERWVGGMEGLDWTRVTEYKLGGVDKAHGAIGKEQKKLLQKALGKNVSLNIPELDVPEKDEVERTASNRQRNAIIDALNTQKEINKIFADHLARSK